MDYEAFVYLWFDSKNRKFYLGSHKGHEDDSYTHSSKVMESFSKAAVPSHMRRRILARGSHEDMKQLENDLLNNRKERCWDKYHNVIVAFPPPPRYGEDCNFYVHGRSGTPELARESNRKYREKNREKILEGARRYREENPEKRRESTQKWREKNREKARESAQKWREKNPEKVREYNQKYREENREKILEESRRYREKNREKILERARRYREKNREKIREKDRKYRHRKKAEKMGTSTLEDFLS